MNLDFGQTYLLHGNRESVVIHHRTVTASQTTIADAKRLCDDVAEMEPSGGAYQAQVLDWRLPAVQVAREILPGDWIEDAQHRLYVVQAADQPQLGAAWRAYTLRLRLEDLGVTITVIPPVDATDSYTSNITNHPTPAANLRNLPCAIIEIGSERVQFQGIVGFRRMFNIWLYSAIDMPEGTLLTDSTGVIYVVVNTSQSDRIDALFKITARIDP